MYSFLMLFRFIIFPPRHPQYDENFLNQSKMTSRKQLVACPKNYLAANHEAEEDFNKNVAHPKMRRRIENSKILLLDCPLEYKKGVWGVLGLFCRGVVRKCVGGIDKKEGPLLLRCKSGFKAENQQQI